MVYGDSRSQSWPISCVLVFALSKELSDKEATSSATYEYRNCFAATSPSFPTTKSLGARTVSFDKKTRPRETSRINPIAARDNIKCRTILSIRGLCDRDRRARTLK